ncbi:hypothetical protein Q7P37_001320 [Cladosporium fusiforme]
MVQVCSGESVDEEDHVGGESVVDRGELARGSRATLWVEGSSWTRRVGPQDKNDASKQERWRERCERTRGAVATAAVDYGMMRVERAESSSGWPARACTVGHSLALASTSSAPQWEARDKQQAVAVRRRTKLVRSDGESLIAISPMTYMPCTPTQTVILKVISVVFDDGRAIDNARRRPCESRRHFWLQINHGSWSQYMGVHTRHDIPPCHRKDVHSKADHAPPASAWLACKLQHLSSARNGGNTFVSSNGGCIDS